MTSKNKSTTDVVANTEEAPPADETPVGLPLDVSKVVSPQIVSAAINSAKQRIAEVATVSPEAAALMNAEVPFWNLVGNQTAVKGKYVKHGIDRMVPVDGEHVEHLRVALATLPVFVDEARRKVRAAIEEWNTAQAKAVDELYDAARAALEKFISDRYFKVEAMGYDFNALFEARASTLIEKRAPQPAVAVHQVSKRGRKSAGKMIDRWKNSAYPHPSLDKPVINGHELVVERVGDEWVLTATNTSSLETMSFVGETVNATQTAFLDATSPAGVSTQRSAVQTFRMVESDELYASE